MTQPQTWKQFLAQKLHRVGEFLVFQGITIAGNLLYGFLCVRLLPLADYAKYAVVFGFLPTLSVLMDVGLSGALLPLIGERINDRRLIADYVASLRQIAHLLYLFVGLVGVIVYPLIVHRQQWAWQVVAGMIVILLVAAWCARVSGAYGAVLIIRRNRKSWYQIQITSSLATLVLLVVAWVAHLLNGFSAILINVAGMAYVAIACFLQAKRLLGVKGTASREKRKAIVHFSAPNLPNNLFYALQGQISLLLLTYFGHATAVASLGALSRLGQIFLLLSPMMLLLVQPYFAKLPKERLKRNYMGIFAVVVLICGTVTGLSFLFPGMFLWILGHKYGSLHYEVSLMLAVNSLGYLYGVLTTVNNACRFVYWWNSVAVIVGTVAIQVVFIWKTDLSTIRGVLTMNLCTGLATLGVAVVTGSYGFIFGPRPIVETAAIDTETDYA
jgi:O-antigen/teichoic acid export membrane protein